METVSCRWSKENNLHLKKKENIIFDHWTKPSNTFILWGAVTGQNGKGQCGAQIVCDRWTAALSGEGWAECSTTGVSGAAARPQRPASHGQSWPCSLNRAVACTILQLWYRPKDKKGPSSSKNRCFFLKLWEINTELLMIKPADCGESVRASTLEGLTSPGDF